MWAFNEDIYLFGGFSLASGWNCDLYRCRKDAHSGAFVFERVDAQGDAPTARDKMSCVVVGAAALIIGGFGRRTAARRRYRSARR